MAPKKLPPLGRRIALPESPAAQAGIGVVLVAVVWLLADRLFDDGVPPGIVVRGLVFGSIYALNAIGLVLVYRATKVVNFAQAEFGAVAAVLSVVFVVQHHWNYFAAIGTGLVIAGLTAVLLERIVIRRFTKAPRLILAVVTIAMAQLLGGVAIVIPLLYDELGEGKFRVPWDASLSVSPVIFDSNYVLALIVVPLVAVALGSFLRFSSHGVAIRGAAENSERASLLGVPVLSLSTLVWLIAGLLSALAVMLRVSVVGFTSFAGVSGGGSSLLLFTLAAAVIGRMESFPRTVLAALFLGVFQELMIWNYSNTTIVDAMLVAVILVALLLQRGALSRAYDTGITSWRAMREAAPIPDDLRALPEVRVAGAAVKIVVVAFVALVPLVASPSQENALTLLLIYSIMSVSLLVLTGWAGHISLGQFALAGFGGATTALLYGRYGLDVAPSILAGALAAGLVSLVIGLPALRIQGPFLAVTTLAFAVTSYTFFLNHRYMPWFIEERIDRPEMFGFIPLERDWHLYELSLVTLVFVMWGVANLRRSRIGRILIATRDNESAASSVTVDTTAAKLTGFVVAGALAGLAGAIYVVQQQGLHTDAFAPGVSLKLFSMIVIGGLTSLSGAVLGAVYVRGAEFFLPTGWDLIATGVGVIVLLAVLPNGLGGVVTGIRDLFLRWVAARRGLEPPGRVHHSGVGADGNVLDEALAGMKGAEPPPAPPSPGPGDGVESIPLDGDLEVELGVSPEAVRP